MTADRPETRCQLYVGHEDEHALLARRRDERALLRWGRTPIQDAPFVPSVSAQLPWAPGHPSLVVESEGRSKSRCGKRGAARLRLVAEGDFLDPREHIA